MKIIHSGNESVDIVVEFSYDVGVRVCVTVL